MGNGKDLRGQVAIVGVGETKQGFLPESNTWTLCIEAATAAMKDAGITKDQVSGLLAVHSLVEPHPRRHLILADYLGLPPRAYNDTTELGGGAFVGAAVRMAMQALAEGQLEYLVVVGGDNFRSALRTSGALGSMMAFHDLEFLQSYGVMASTNFALVAQRNMHEYGWTSEQFAEIACIHRYHASLHPNAVNRNPITVDDVLESRMICSPFHLLDCSIISDGGAAIVLTSAERAKDSPNKPVYVMGVGSVNLTYHMTSYPDLTEYPRQIINQSATEAYEMAGFGPEDIDVASVPDVFTGMIPLGLEGAGFCKLGEGAEFAASGEIRLGGSLPLNTHGGNLSYSHPGSHGQFLHTLELIRQLRGDAGERQVPDARTAFQHGWGGPFGQHASVVLATGE